MPRFLSTEDWVNQIPVIAQVDPAIFNMMDLITREIFQLVKEERMSASFLSRVVTITARCEDYIGLPILTLRFNILNRDPIQFAYKIDGVGKDYKLTRYKDADNFGKDV